MSLPLPAMLPLQMMLAMMLRAANMLMLPGVDDAHDDAGHVVMMLMMLQAWEPSP